MSIPDYLQKDILNYAKDKLEGNDSFILYETAVGSVGLAYKGGEHIDDEERKQLYDLIDVIKKLDISK